MKKRTIGIVAAPQFPTELGTNLTETLLEQLSYQFEEEIDGEVEVVTDAFIAVTEEVDTLVDVSEKYKIKMLDNTTIKYEIRVSLPSSSLELYENNNTERVIRSFQCYYFNVIR